MTNFKRVSHPLLIIACLIFSPPVFADTVLSSAIKSENTFSQEEIQTAVGLSKITGRDLVL